MKDGSSESEEEISDAENVEEPEQVDGSSEDEEYAPLFCLASFPVLHLKCLIWILEAPFFELYNCNREETFGTDLSQSGCVMVRQNVHSIRSLCTLK